MKFIKVANQQAADSYLEAQIRALLSKHLNIAWFVSGGSNLAITIAVLQNLLSEDLSHLTVLLADERFGPYNHLDSNALQLQESGPIIESVKFIATIDESGSSFEETVDNYKKVVASIFEKSDYVIGQLGMGTDGHTAGILPDSVSTNPGEELVVGYQAPDFQRITVTFNAIKRMNCVDLLAFGANKSEALTKLHDDAADLSITSFPVSIIRESPEAYIINDVIGDES